MFYHEMSHWKENRQLALLVIPNLLSFRNERRSKITSFYVSKEKVGALEKT